MIKRFILPFVVLLALGGTAAYFYAQKKGDQEPIVSIKTTVKKGTFSVNVTATGELQALRSEKIRGPQNMRKAGIWRVTIADLVPEGTLVNEGDYVARLDRSEIESKLQDLNTEIEKVKAQLTQATLDTAINMRELRDGLVNVRFSMKEKQLELQQSRYEPPAVIKRVELDLERLQRDYNQLQTNYILKQEQANARIRETLTTLQQAENRFNEILTLSNEFTIQAPKSGMVIYERTWEGKIAPGSQVSSWDPVVAQLPDLTEMISKTYVNEVDINKIRKKQRVQITIDALEGKVYEGTITDIANIGEQLKQFDAKVFEVIVRLNEVDSMLRPAMTTSNQIETTTYKNVLFIPLEAVHTDSATYVYVEEKSGSIRKQIVTLGAFNENEIIIQSGLAEGETILLTLPNDAEKIPFSPLPNTLKGDVKQNQEKNE